MSERPPRPLLRVPAESGRWRGS
ncbi:MAG: hypothetical protein JWO77_284, partial [Ilumatobacteraceae bacterium]|nr:hypothetical protein [Ilumatobacteraceae bacterium]